MTKKLKVGIIGGGNMGGAILAGIYKKYQVSVCELDAKKARALKAKYRVSLKGQEELLKSADIVILAVKPQVFDAVLKSLKGGDLKGKLFISIAAGITSTYIEKRLGAGVRVIRSMPNLPAQIGQGVTGLAKGKWATAKDLKTAEAIFGCIGLSVKVKESHMDAITAVSGSGPAYVFQFVEHFEAAAKSVGLEKKLAEQCVRETILGSLNLLWNQKEDAATLRKRVTSKGGTTEAALKTFEKKQTKENFKSALKAAKLRAKQLSRS